MERITVFDGKFWAHKNFPPVKDDTVDEFVDCVKELAARLAAYEETGLEPEDMKRAFNEDATLKLAGQILGMSPDRLRELAQAEKEGRLVVLPCDVGDKLYDVTLGEVREKIVISLSMLLSKSVNHLVIHAENFRNAVTSYELQDIGKTFFLTREAAEAALKEREAEYDTGRTTIGNSRLLG